MSPTAHGEKLLSGKLPLEEMKMLFPDFEEVQDEEPMMLHPDFEEVQDEEPFLSRKRPLWLIMAVALVLLVGSGIAVLQLTQGNAARANKPFVVGAARIEVSQDTLDYGDVKLGTSLDSRFTIRNVGNHDLLILETPRVDVAEGCCAPTASLSSSTIRPGDEATLAINLTMHDGQGGKHRFIVHVRTNDPAQQDKQLIILSNWTS